MTLRQLKHLIAMSLIEGGLKLPPEKRTDLTPKLVKQAEAVYLDVIAGWNRWLQAHGHEPVEPIRLSGSSTHADKDVADKPETIYGDVDYLVSFPVEYDSDDITAQRKSDAASDREYTDLLGRYLSEKKPKHVDVEATLRGSPLQVIVRLQDDVLVQIDTTITHPQHAQWMKGRYTPERGIKGYVTGNLYKALGDVLTLTIGTEGVLARIKDGKRVASNVRAGVTFKRVSNSFETFLVDIARFLAGSDVELAPMLKRNPGLDSDAVSIETLAKGIVGLAQTLDNVGKLDSHQMLEQVLARFKAGIEENVDKKASRELEPAKLAKLKKLNIDQYKRIKQIFGV